eukprot:6476545-Amphidinium_carterae.1
MLGKRVVQLPADPDAAKGKRLRANIIDLAATGSVTARRVASILNDAFDAGVRECYSAASKRGCTKPVLFNEFLKDSDWPKLALLPVPLLGKAGAEVGSANQP